MLYEQNMDVKNSKAAVLNQPAFDAPIRVKIMLFGNNPGHIGVRAWVPGTTNRYSIHFIDFPASYSYFMLHLDLDNADNDIDACRKSFEFTSNHRLSDLIKWHQESAFFRRQDWGYYHNCADAMHSMMHDFFGYEITRNKSKMFSYPISSCLWGVTRIALPKLEFADLKLAVEKNISEQQRRITP